MEEITVESLTPQLLCLVVRRNDEALFQLILSNAEVVALQDALAKHLGVHATNEKVVLNLPPGQK
jgi:hypothetical protein